MNIVDSSAWLSFFAGEKNANRFSAVIDKTKKQLASFAESLENANIESVEIAVKRGSMEAEGLQYQSKLPVEIFKLTKQ